MAVIGTGTNRCCPSENRELQDETAERGTVLGQFLPDAPPTGRGCRPGVDRRIPCGPVPGRAVSRRLSAWRGERDPGGARTTGRSGPCSGSWKARSASTPRPRGRPCWTRSTS
ncbi:hypothetical protein [Actinorugispora endophytica]